MTGWRGPLLSGPGGVWGGGGRGADCGPVWLQSAACVRSSRKGSPWALANQPPHPALPLFLLVFHRSLVFVPVVLKLAVFGFFYHPSSPCMRKAGPLFNAHFSSSFYLVSFLLFSLAVSPSFAPLAFLLSCVCCVCLCCCAGALGGCSPFLI